jgi:hypothetical protein
MLNISANEFRALLIDAGIIDDEEKLGQQDVSKRMLEMKAFVEEMKVTHRTVALSLLCCSLYCSSFHFSFFISLVCLFYIILSVCILSFLSHGQNVKSALARLRRESSSNTTQVTDLEGRH